MGVKEETFGDKEVKLCFVYPEIKEDVYKITSNVNYKDGLTENSLIKITKNNAGKAILKFTVNSENEITEIANAPIWYLFGNEKKAIDRTFPLFENNDRQEVYIYDVDDDGAWTNGKTIITNLRGAEYVVLCKEEGGIVPKKAVWNDLICKNSDGVKITIYGDDDACPRLVVVYGDTENIASFTSIDTAIISDKALCYDPEEDEIYTKFTIITSSGEQELRMKGEYADILQKNMYIEYRPGANFSSDSNVKIERYEKLPSSFEEWTQMSGIYSGFVKKIDKHRMFLNNGAAYQLARSATVFGVDFSAGETKFKSMDFEDVEEGDRVIFMSKCDISLIYVDVTGK